MAAVNTQNPSAPGDEANLDIQYTVGLATGVPTTFLSSGVSSNEGFLDMVNFILAESNPPQVLTTSYAFNEIGLSPAFAKYVVLLLGGVRVPDSDAIREAIRRAIHDAVNRDSGRFGSF